MVKITKKEFLQDVQKRDIMHLGSTSKLNVEEMFEIIEEKLPTFPITYNRVIYKISNSKITFLCKNSDKITESALYLNNCTIYKRDNVYIIDNNDIRIGYLLSNDYTLSNLIEEYQKQIEIETKKEQLKELEEKNKKEQE